MEWVIVLGVALVVFLVGVILSDRYPPWGF